MIFIFALYVWRHLPGKCLFWNNKLSNLAAIGIKISDFTFFSVESQHPLRAKYWLLTSSEWICSWVVFFSTLRLHISQHVVPSSKSCQSDTFVYVDNSLADDDGGSDEYDNCYWWILMILWITEKEMSKMFLGAFWIVAHILCPNLIFAMSAAAATATPLPKPKQLSGTRACVLRGGGNTLKKPSKYD